MGLRPMSDSQTDDAIRQLLKEQEAEQHPTRDDKKHRKTKKNRRNPTEGQRRDPANPIFGPFMQRLWAIARKHPPTRRQILFAALALLILLRPWFVFWVILLTLAVMVIVYLTLGPDECAEKVAKTYRWYARKQPKKAERLRQRASSILKRISVLLEKLPERWTQGTYLPDLDEAPSKLDDRPDPFDRLGE